MTVVSTVEGVECDEREYPWIGVMAGTYVLFSANGVGTVIADTSEAGDCEVGHHDDDWDIDMFERFDGSIRLANEGIDILVLEEDE